MYFSQVEIFIKIDYILGHKNGKRKHTKYILIAQYNHLGKKKQYIQKISECRATKEHTSVLLMGQREVSH